MRSSSMACTTTRPRRASLASCQRQTPPTPLDTPDLTGTPQTFRGQLHCGFVEQVPGYRNIYYASSNGLVKIESNQAAGPACIHNHGSSLSWKFNVNQKEQHIHLFVIQKEMFRSTVCCFLHVI